ncbi:hypothetical protein B0T21DRAFT_406978 [Apiosordaria backusii]|uniref:Uncharacterized protein n=1 Tax=Apiosordaria backusii TaxID=314023 RepID=A0AA40EZK3_9PEZI|nr:hypothetical protein B0T21DRAFT_406978 [Apiosordaria backusii]
MVEREANIRAFLGIGSQGERAKPSKASFRVKRKPANSVPAVRPKQARQPTPNDTRQPRPNNATDAGGHQDVKPLPTTPYPLSETMPSSVRNTVRANTTSQQVSKLPPPPRQFPSPKLSFSPMSLSTLKRTLDTLHLTLSHTRFVVTGTAAMAIWGYHASKPHYLPTQISILCPTDDLSIIQSWAACTPHCHILPSSQSHTIGILIDGKIRAVKIKTISRAMFEKLGRVSPTEQNKTQRFEGWRGNIMRTGAWVLELGGMLEVLVGSWMGGYYTNTGDKKGERKMERCGLWILWILRRLRDDFRQGKQHWDLNKSMVAKEDFWVPFTGVWPEGVGLLLGLGLLREASAGDGSSSSLQGGVRQRKVWTGTRWLVVTSVASTSSSTSSAGEHGEEKGKGKEEHISLTTMASSSCPLSEGFEEFEVPIARLDSDLARFHPDSFRVRAGLRDGSVSMREYVALVAAQAGRGQQSRGR